MSVNSTRASLVVTTLAALMCLATPVRAAQSPTLAECVQNAEQAQELRSEGEISAARAALAVCVRDECPDVVRRDCSQWTEELDEATGAIVLEAVNEFGEPLTEVFVLLDGEEADVDDGRISVPPGTHVMRVEAENRIAVLKTVEVPEQTEIVVQATLLPIADADADAFELRSDAPRESPAAEDEAASAPVWPWIAAGVGAVGFASFAYFGLEGKSEADALRESCGGNQSCSDDQVDAVRTNLTIADVSLGVGLVGVGVAVWGLLSNSPSADEAEVSSSAQGAKRPVLSAHGNSVVAKWQF